MSPAEPRRLAADENFDGRIVRGLHLRIEGLDLVRVQDTPLLAAGDPDVLEWCAREGRILLSHDRGTLIGHAFSPADSTAPMSGLIVVRTDTPIGWAIDDLVEFISTGEVGALEGRVLFLPFPRPEPE